MPKFVYDGLEYSSNGHVVKLTQAEYDALPNTKLADDIIYLIIDSNDDKFEARNLPYDGSITGLGNTVQDAIDNLASHMHFFEFTSNDSTSYEKEFIVNGTGLIDVTVNNFFPSIVKGYGNRQIIIYLNNQIIALNGDRGNSQDAYAVPIGISANVKIPVTTGDVIKIYTHINYVDGITNKRINFLTFNCTINEK